MNAYAILGDPFAEALAAVRLAASRSAADAQEVHALVAGLPRGDADAWVDAWSAAAGSAWAVANAAAQERRRVSAVAHFRRAASGYAVAAALAPHAAEPERHHGLWRRQRVCWDKLAALRPVQAKRIAIPYEATTLPGYFFRTETSSARTRPLIIVVHGDGPTSHAWLRGGAAASERGMHWMTFDGPGQEAALFEQGLALRPDWEAVLGPVLDVAQALPGVDRKRIAVVATGPAGQWVMQALTVEHRLAAAVVDPGMCNLAEPWMQTLPSGVADLLAEGDQVAFDRELRLAELCDPTLSGMIRHRALPFAPGAPSRFALFDAMRRFRLDDRVAHVTTPVLIADGDARWLTQTQTLARELGDRASLVRFGGEDGSEPVPPAARESRIFDWLESRLE